jgi:hypothetical protein
MKHTYFAYSISLFLFLSSSRPGQTGHSMSLHNGSVGSNNADWPKDVSFRNRMIGFRFSR